MPARRPRTERILYYTGRSHKIGEVHEGTATMDLDGPGAGARHHHHLGGDHGQLARPPGEHHRYAGHVDFTIEVERSLRVLDGAVAVFDAVSGVEPQSETVWRQADKYGVPRICFVNKMDRVGADFARCVDMIEERFGVTAALLQLPVGIEADFTGVVDLIAMKAIVWRDDSLGAKFDTVEIPAELRQRAEERRTRLVELVVEQDDAAMEAYLEGEEPDEATLRACVRTGALARAFVPVLMARLSRTRGCSRCSTPWWTIFPPPVDVPAIRGVAPKDDREEARRSSDDEPFAALAFKVMADRYVGTLTFARVYSGVLKSGDQLLNTVKGRAPARRAHAADARQQPRGHPGGPCRRHRGAVRAEGGRQRATRSATRAGPSCWSAWSFRSGDRGRRGAPDQGRPRQDGGRAGPAGRGGPFLPRRLDHESGQTVIKGMGELHLDIIVDRMKREFNVVANVGAPQVAYRETIARAHDIDYIHRKQTGGSGQFAA